MRRDHTPPPSSGSGGAQGRARPSRPRDAPQRHAPALGGRSGPRVQYRPHRRFRTRGFHSNGCAGRQALLPPETPQGRRSSLWQRKRLAVRRLERAAFTALRSRDPGALRKRARCGRPPGFWPRVAVDEGRASPACRPHSLQGSMRPTPSSGPARYPRGSSPRGRSERLRWPG